MGPLMTTDLPARWASEPWRAEAQAWIEQCVSAAGRRLVGPIETVRIAFWSVVMSAPTDAGTVWFKENAPSQAFEAGLMTALQELTPGRTPPVLGADPARGWLLTVDLGLPIAADPVLEDDAEAVAALVEVVSMYAEVQRTLAQDQSTRRTVRVPAFPSADAVGYAATLADQLAVLPPGDKRRLDESGQKVVAEGLRQLAQDAERLEASGIPDSLQHNDLHLWNALRAPDGGVAIIDLGDAVWSHPFASLRIPSWILRARLDYAPGSPEYADVVDAYLDPWGEYGSPGQLRSLLPAAERLSCLHRAETWRRLQADVPLACVDEEWVDAPAYWLTAACSPDPYLATHPESRTP